ncbi:MAG: DUF3127 domain-containing protein [Luteolibacter sp.]
MYETSGKLKLIYDTQTFASGFSKREFVVTTQDKYPQDLKFEVVKEKCSLLDGFQPDQDVVVNFDIRGNEYNGRYYVNLSCWKIQAAGSQASSRPQATTASSSSEPSVSDLRNEDDFDDDEIPF